MYCLGSKAPNPPSIDVILERVVFSHCNELDCEATIIAPPDGCTKS